MPSPNGSFLSKIASKIPGDGAFWITGKLFKDLIAELQKDRARGGDNIDEIQTPSGRFFKAKSDNSSSRQPFELRVASDGMTLKIRIYPSTLDGGSSVDLGFTEGDPSPGYLFTVAADGVIYGVITIDDETGEVTSKSLGSGSTLPTDDETTFHVEIGTYDVDDDILTVANSRYGPIGVNVCRDWFSNPATYGVSFT